MRLLLVLSIVVVGVVGVACSGSSVDPVNGTILPGLQYSGAVAMTPTGATGGVVEISAPILPDSRIWQYSGGNDYPATQAAAVALIMNTTLTYESLLTACVAKYPSITLAMVGQKLTAEQIRTNYDQVSRCAYNEHGSKPYWMPQILNDVDVCALKLGIGWRLLSEADLNSFTEVDYQFFRDTMTIEKDSDWFPRQFYFSLDVYVRGADGSLLWGDMTPGAVHINPLPVTDLRQLYVGNGRPIGVRCVRMTTQP